MALADLGDANNTFTANLYQILFSKAIDRNLVFSPFGLHTVLGMLGIGSRGLTRTEIFDGIRLEDTGDNDIAQKYHAVITGIQEGAHYQDDKDAYTWLAANRIYSPHGPELRPKYVNCLKDNFMVEPKQYAMLSSKGRKKSEDKINEWVSSTTKDKITNIIAQDLFDAATRVTLVSGIYFSGLWEFPFKSCATFKQEFQVNTTHTVFVDMMNIRNKFAYAELPELDAEAVSLPYKGGRLSLIIILPKTVEGLKKFQYFLRCVITGGRDFDRVGLRPKVDVQVSLPKFRLEAAYTNLKPIVKRLGMTCLVCRNNANFDGMYTHDHPEEMLVSDVPHKAIIEVNDETAEAEVGARGGGKHFPGESPIQFLVDRPFYFQVVDNSNNELVLISGHCYDPTDSECHQVECDS